MKKAQLAIIIAFITQVLLVLFILTVSNLPPDANFALEQPWQSIFGLTIRITGASWVAFLACQMLDAHVFSFLKKKYKNKLWLRSVFSDVVDLTLDSVIFITLAFYGNPGTPLLAMIVGQIITKNVIGVLDTPWFYWYKKMLGKK
jgi:hypothetical protein